jgi:hypothetical protein
LAFGIKILNKWPAGGKVSEATWLDAPICKSPVNAKEFDTKIMETKNKFTRISSFLAGIRVPPNIASKVGYYDIIARNGHLPSEKYHIQ